MATNAKRKMKPAAKSVAIIRPVKERLTKSAILSRIAERTDL